MIRKTSLLGVLWFVFLAGTAAGQPLEVQDASVISMDKRLELEERILKYRKCLRESFLHDLFSEFDEGSTLRDRGILGRRGRQKQAPVKTTFRLTFEFDGREPGDLTHINEALSTMKLSELELENVDGGYLETRILYKGDSEQITGYKYRYGCHKLSLICTYDEAEKMHYYRLTAMAFAKGKFKDTEEFHELWDEAHPDRIMRMLTYYSSEDADVFIVLHHEKDLAVN